MNLGKEIKCILELWDKITLQYICLKAKRISVELTTIKKWNDKQEWKISQSSVLGLHLVDW